MYWGSPFDDFLKRLRTKAVRSPAESGSTFRKATRRRSDRIANFEFSISFEHVGDRCVLTDFNQNHPCIDVIRGHHAATAGSIPPKRSGGKHFNLGANLKSVESPSIQIDVVV